MSRVEKAVEAVISAMDKAFAPLSIDEHDEALADLLEEVRARVSMARGTKERAGKGR